MSEPANTIGLPLTLPLKGSRLVQASAGTGKTWTIAALYVRLVLGHGEGLGRALAPGEILVMTFTKAATRELSDRIRHRLVEAAAFFRRAEVGSAQGQGDDEFLLALRRSYAPGQARDRAAWRLAAAAEAMDDASVHTIDAWCQRMLREHAFDSGCLFDEELQPNETQMLRQAAQDYWRQQVYPLRGETLAAVLAQWRSVSVLIEDVRPLIEKPLPPSERVGLADMCADWSAAQAHRLALLKLGWEQRADAMLAWLQVQWQRPDCPLNKRSLGPEQGKRWLAALRDWARDPQQAKPELKSGEKNLRASSLPLAAKGGPLGTVPSVFFEFENLMDELSASPTLAPLLRAHALVHVRERLQQLKGQAGRYGYADMLLRLHDALDEPARGENARQLRERIVAQYPAALIDEFQDTSPRQLGIFERIYRIEADDPARVLLLIGDPKQSIYGFRGADIHSYLRARTATTGRHHTLDTNHRSARPLVEAVNVLFGRAEARAGRGAFLFRHAMRAGSEGLPFEPVQAQGRGEVLQRAGQGVPALTFCVDTELGPVAEHRARFAALCAERIVVLLNDASATFVGSEAGASRSRRLEPSHIAVLVRTGGEAEAVQRALRRRGVASVYLSDKDSVYQRPEAVDLQRLLQAVAEPRHVRLARAAFATRLLGRTLPELLHLAADDLAFDALADHLRSLHGVWQAQGVLAMLRRALHLFEIPKRLFAAGDGEGERRLTNVLHLAELLQAASGAVEGEAALVRWLAGQIDAAQGDYTPAEELVLRLESDADLVQVVTVHKSKGLEYGVVFVPFASVFRGTDARNTTAVLLRDAETGERRLNLAPDKAALAAHDEERLQEDLRLLYVALTRARHALWVGAAPLGFNKSKECLWPRSALGYLVSGEAPCEAPNVARDLHELSEAVPAIVVEEPEANGPPPITPAQARAVAAALPVAREYDGTFERHWAIGSYSGLVRDALRGVGHGTGATPPEPPTPMRVQRDDDDEPELIVVGAEPVADRPWHRFPRGAFAGNFLHDQLEWLAGEGFALADSPALREALQRRCERQGWGHRSADVGAWLQRAVSTPLPPLGAALDQLDGRVLPEMEFWLPADGLDIAQLDALCHEHLFPHEPRPALTPRLLKGLLMGFADLVFEHAGPGPTRGADTRYWVLDYKSNTLGTRDADYTEAAMRTAMLRHRYDVQAALYLLALHLLLRLRLEGHYEPARDLGGAIYFFLRGVGHAGMGCQHVVAPPALLSALEAMLPMGREAPTSTHREAPPSTRREAPPS